MATSHNDTNSFFANAYENYKWALSKADSRTKGWPLVGSPVYPVLLVCAYLAFVYFGPKIMRKREAFKLKWTLVIFNFCIVLLNGYIFIEFLDASTRLNYSWVCQPLLHSNQKEESRIVNAFWWFYFTKVPELFDTVFFILRKKEKQLSFLHVYHHAVTLLVFYIGSTWCPSGTAIVPAFLNSFIHVLMYAYYGLAALGPKVAKYLWWKKYLTTLQIIQLITVSLNGVTGFIFDCGFPKPWLFMVVTYVPSLVILFSNFYMKSYIPREKIAMMGNYLFKFGGRRIDFAHELLVSDLYSKIQSRAYFNENLSALLLYQMRKAPTERLKLYCIDYGRPRNIEMC